ncbi:hypothetical protein B0H19DRAFT_1295757, partial [Mycena capillaripes]
LVPFYVHSRLSHKTLPSPSTIFSFCAKLPFSSALSAFFSSCRFSHLPPMSSSITSADNGRSFFEHPSHADNMDSAFVHPRPAPLLPSPPSSRSACSTPEGFVLPVIPPVHEPFVVAIDSHGHRQLPRVSDAPLSVDDHRVLKLVRDIPVVAQKCYDCAEKAIDCSFTEAGIPCSPCAILGMPDCRWSDPHWFMEHLRRKRDHYLLEERDALVMSVRENRLAPSLFQREFERAQSWFYSGAQGAISRFLVNSHATHDIAVRGYHALAAASTDPATLLRFLSLGSETGIHPIILQLVAERVQALFVTMSS